MICYTIQIVNLFKLFFCFSLFFSCISQEKEKKSFPIKDYNSFHKEAHLFCENHQMNDQFYLLIDMKIHSGRNRFFVIDFKTRQIIDQGLVTHGACNVYSPNHSKDSFPKFSNRDGSHCTSVGKYKIGKRDYSSWGIRVKYWLHGLETTNSNAENRVVVLHSWEAVNDQEIYPDFSPLSWGCPAVSDHFMRRLDQRLQQIQKPVLLWIVGS